jgi:hypothetical protein
MTRKQYYDFIDSLPTLNKNGQLAPGTRTRCFDLDTLEVVLMYYATRKLKNDANNNQWNDYNATDPRVFQGCVWSAESTYDNDNENGNDDAVNSWNDDDKDSNEDQNHQQATEDSSQMHSSEGSDIDKFEEQDQETASPLFDCSNNDDRNNVTTASDNNLGPALTSINKTDNEEKNDEEKEQEVPLIDPPMPQVRRSQRLANALRTKELLRPTPPILRRSPRLALIPRVSYVGMC